MADTPQRLGDYQILRVLGSGGMGRVYQVRNVITDRVEAMKVLLPEISGNEEVAARFQREIKVLAALNHPHIATLHTALIIDNQLVMLMEYVLGQPISAMLAKGAIPVPEALNYIDQVLDALSYAHQHHVIHRDIKPANMMVTLDGVVKLMDFGIARTESEPTLLTAPGSTLGSINYMSPEQVRGEPTDERSDLYSLGISLYEMVTGERPFHADSSFSLMTAHLNQAPTPPVQLRPELPEALNSIVLTAIAKQPQERFQSADAFRNALRTVMRDLPAARSVIQTTQDATLPTIRTPLPATSPIARPATQAPAPTATSLGIAPTAPTLRPPSPPASTTPATVAPSITNRSVASPSPVQTAVPTVLSAAPPPSRNRGLFISLGAIIVLIVLIGAGLYIPKRQKAAAAPETGPSSVRPATPTATTPTAPSAPAAAQPTPPAAAPVAAQPEIKPAEAIQPPPPPVSAKKSLNRSGSVMSASDAQAAQAEAAAKARAAELDVVEHQIDQLTGRAASVNSSLDSMQRQQAGMGLGMRGDIAEAAGSMKLNLAKAQDAVSHGDLDRAKRYSALAEANVEKLEKFLGR